METLAILFMVVVLPVFVVFGYATFDRWAKLKQKELTAVSHETAEKAAQYAAKSERLEQRVATLERIITDRSGALADEIDALEDRPLN